MNRLVIYILFFVASWIAPGFSDDRLYMVIDLSGGTLAENYSVSYLSKVPEGGWSDEFKTGKLVLRHMPQKIHQRNTDFYMGVFEITQRQWELVMGNRPSWFRNDKYYATRPVEQVSMDEIWGSSALISQGKGFEVYPGSFLGRLAEKTGTYISLPKKMEWVRAWLRDRLLTTWRYQCDQGYTFKKCRLIDKEDPVLGRIARYEKNHPGGVYWDHADASTDGGTAAVGSYEPNELGLYDMTGNVAELCQWEFGGSDALQDYRKNPKVLYLGYSFADYHSKMNSISLGTQLHPWMKHAEIGFRITAQP